MANTHTRRVYLSQQDSEADDAEFNEHGGMRINVKAANLTPKPDELLSVALVRASLPNTLTTPGLTTVPAQTFFPAHVDWIFGQKIDPNLQVLTLGVGNFTGTWTSTSQTLVFFIFNDPNTVKLNNGMIHTYWGDWTLQTTMIDLIAFINASLTSLGRAEQLKIYNNSGAAHRIAVTDPTKCVTFVQSQSSRHIIEAFGMYSYTTLYQNPSLSQPTVIGTQTGTGNELVSPYQFSVASVMGEVFLKSNLATDSFISWGEQGNKGAIENILASIPTAVSNNVSGFKLTSATYSNTLEAETDEPLIPAQINYTNWALTGSHKPIANHRIGNIILELVDSRNVPVGVGSNTWEVVLEFKFIKSYN